MKSLKRDQDLLHPLNVMMRSHDLALAAGRFLGAGRAVLKRVMFSQLSVELYLAGGIPYTYPSEKYEFVRWDDYSRYMER